MRHDDYLHLIIGLVAAVAYAGLPANIPWMKVVVAVLYGFAMVTLLHFFA
jgi:hypothetical protein